MVSVLRSFLLINNQKSTKSNLNDFQEIKDCEFDNAYIVGEHADVNIGTVYEAVIFITYWSLKLWNQNYISRKASVPARGS